MIPHILRVEGRNVLSQHVLRYQEVGLEHMNLGRTQVSPQQKDSTVVGTSNCHSQKCSGGQEFVS